LRILGRLLTTIEIRLSVRSHDQLRNTKERPVSDCMIAIVVISLASHEMVASESVIDPPVFIRIHTLSGGINLTRYTRK
jgi:hypothetical protein